MRSLAYDTGYKLSLRSFGLDKVAAMTGPAPGPGALPPIQPPKWTTRIGTGPTGGSFPGAAAGAAEEGLKGFTAKLKGKPLLGAGMALGAGAGLAMMNPSEPRMSIVPSQPIQQYFP